MRRPCSLCQTQSWPEVHAFFVEDGVERRVCSKCSERLASLILDSERERLASLFHLPCSFEGLLMPSNFEEESSRRYAELGLLDDALVEAAEALSQIPDGEIRAQAIEVIFGLLRDPAWPALRSHLFPA